MTTNLSLREMFIADPGYVLVDLDLAGADAQVVAWDAGDEPLKKLFRTPGFNLHNSNALDIYGPPLLPDKRQKAKIGVHAVNYGVRERTLAASLGTNVGEAGEFKRLWFRAHPAIPRWHKRVLNELYTTHSVSNKWGFRRRYFDRIDEYLLPQALAWIGQSTVAITINKIYSAIEQTLPSAEALLQVHDSLLYQVRIDECLTLIPQMEELARIPIPYPDPLIIPATLKMGANMADLIPASEWFTLTA